MGQSFVGQPFEECVSQGGLDEVTLELSGRRTVLGTRMSSSSLVVVGSTVVPVVRSRSAVTQGTYDKAACRFSVLSKGNEKERVG